MLGSKALCHRVTSDGVRDFDTAHWTVNVLCFLLTMVCLSIFKLISDRTEVRHGFACIKLLSVSYCLVLVGLVSGFFICSTFIYD